VLLLDDGDAFTGGCGWVDPLLLLAVIDRALRSVMLEAGPHDEPLPVSVNAAGRIELNLMMSAHPLNLRREVSLVLRSGALRNLHDLVMAVGFGADAVAPYLLLEAALDDPSRRLDPQQWAKRLSNTLKALNLGIEKVTSTMGIHELRGYGRLFGSIGLGEPLAQAMNTVNYGA
jgi:glutamate synthase (NADPH/NADH) large chain